MSSTVPLWLPSLVVALSSGWLTAIVSVLRRVAGSLQRSSRCDIQLAVEFIIKGKYLKLRDVCLLEPTHTRGKISSSVQTAGTGPSCSSVLRESFLWPQAGLCRSARCSDVLWGSDL